MPGAHDLPEDGKFTDMVSVVIGHNQDFAEDSVIRGMGNRRIEISFRIGHDITKGAYIGEE